MVLLNKMVTAIECHQIDEVKKCFELGLSPNINFEGRPLVKTLIEMYNRGPNFSIIFNLFVKYGLDFEDKILLAIFENNAKELENQLVIAPALLNKKYTFPCAFTPLYEASLLHICAEYNHLSCAKVLLKLGLDINTPAGIDKNGFGGQTAIFHTVNQHQNFNFEFLYWLLENNANLHHTIKGLIWGQGFDWETYIPSVNPISYAMMGLLRQFQRNENDVYKVVQLLQNKAFQINYQPQNVPNMYLQS